MSKAQAAPAEPCPGCGRAYPPLAGPTHAYIGASAACWARYGELLALEYGDPALMRWHRLTVDAYAAQHPGVPGRRSAQSVHVHLAALHLWLEKGVEPAAITRALKTMADGRTYAWLEPPSLATAVGLSEVIAAAAGLAYGDTVAAWAEAVWHAWAPHHAAIRAEAAAALTSH